jgi:hypothetical protein
MAGTLWSAPEESIVHLECASKLYSYSTDGVEASVFNWQAPLQNVLFFFIVSIFIQTEVFYNIDTLNITLDLSQKAEKGIDT